MQGHLLRIADLSLVRRHTKKPREKIEPDPAHPIYIRTVPRHGYAPMVPTAKATP
jgi:DNA-binding response OmpR family regulator